ncbi:MAG: NAD(P)H-hydrate dehydratase, partial [Clostridia bacterium]|nr:NAD(P)H-hydrate dehydratase [Clostridia bacterium]
GVALPATQTLAIAAPKPGHLLYPGAALCGRLSVADIGIYSDSADAHLLEKEDLSALPPRPENAHKGRFGRVLIIGGAVGMSGAAYFAAKAALRAGAGLVEILAPHENRVIYQTQLPEALLTLYDPEALDEALLLNAISRADAVAVGMGLSQSDTALRLTALALAATKVPLVADADALNLMGRDPALLELCCQRSEPTVLTPHLMEMSRISATPIPVIAADPIGHAKRIAATVGAVVVQKDARTVISDGTEVYLNAFGNSGMATGGSGDVLAGVIASFAAQGAKALDAARLGVLAHALAGDAALRHRGNHGLIASDIIDGLCEVLP